MRYNLDINAQILKLTTQCIMVGPNDVKYQIWMLYHQWLLRYGLDKNAKNDVIQGHQTKVKGHKQEKYIFLESGSPNLSPENKKPQIQ